MFKSGGVYDKINSGIIYNNEYVTSGEDFKINNKKYTLVIKAKGMVLRTFNYGNILFSHCKITEEILEIFIDCNGKKMNKIILDLLLSGNDIKQKLGINLYNLQKSSI